MTKYTKYSTYLVAPFFSNGTELFAKGYISKAQAEREIAAYIEDQYTLEDRVSYKIYSY